MMIMKNNDFINEPLHKMFYGEREKLKAVAEQLPTEELRQLVVLIAHWMRNPPRVHFDEYAANWIASEKRVNLDNLKSFYPLHGKRMIADNHSDWGSYKQPKGEKIANR
jgi:hypothetical protein